MTRNTAAPCATHGKRMIVFSTWTYVQTGLLNQGVNGIQQRYNRLGYRQYQLFLTPLSSSLRNPPVRLRRLRCPDHRLAKV
jgi:hypothetical protein